MPLDTVNALVGALLAISLASERVVTIAKTYWPSLATPRVSTGLILDLHADKPRMLAVQFISFAASLLTCWGMYGFHWLIPFGSTPSIEMPLPLLALLASSGSAFWSNVLGYTKALKDNQNLNRTASSLAISQKAQTSDTNKGVTGALQKLRDKPAPTI